MTSFYAAASTARRSWYTREDFGSFPAPVSAEGESEPSTLDSASYAPRPHLGELTSPNSVDAAVCRPPTRQPVPEQEPARASAVIDGGGYNGGSVRGTTNGAASGHSPSAPVAAIAAAGSGPGEMPSFYGRANGGGLGKFFARPPLPDTEKRRPRSSNEEASRSSPYDLQDDARSAVAGDSLSITPKRGDRSTACRELDRDLSSAATPADVLSLMEKSLTVMDAPNWANLFYALAHLKKKKFDTTRASDRGPGAPASSLPAWLQNDRRWAVACREILPRLPELTAKDAANVLWSVATLDGRNEPMFAEVADALPSKLAVCDPISVSKAAWALSQGGTFSREKRLAIFTQLAVPVVLRAEVFPLGALTMICYAFAKAALRDSEVYAALSSAVSRFPHEELRPVDVCNVVWAFCTVGYRDDALFDHLCEGHLSRPEAVRHFNPQDLSNTTWGLSKVGYIHRPAMDALASAGVEQRDAFKAIHFSNFFYSFAMLRLHGPEGFLTTMADLAVQKIQSFDPGNLAIAVWALAQLQVRHSFIDHALRIVTRPEVCGKLMSRTLSMLFLAFFRLGRPSDVNAIFDVATSIRTPIGASGWSARMMTGEQGRDVRYEARLLDAMADEANDDRMRGAIGNAAAIRLAKGGATAEAIALLRQMREDTIRPRRWSAVSAKLLRRLETEAGYEPSTGSRGPPQEGHQPPVVSSLHPIAATRQNEGPHAYAREFMTLQAVLCGAPAGDVDACMAAVEQFAESRSLWLKITAWEKAVVVHEVAKLQRPNVVVEIGAYVGYSAMNIARAIRPHGGRLASIEVDPIHSVIVRNMVEYAGLSDNVDVYTGYGYDVIPHLLEIYGKRSIGMVFMDQKGTRFHTDLQLFEDLELLADGAVILSDNVLKPGAPLYIHHLCSGPYIEPTAVSVREFLLQSEDWMVMGFYDQQGRPVTSVPPQLHITAFESDNFRKRSMFDQVAPSKADWWKFSQSFIESLDRNGVKPRIVGLHGRDNPVIKPQDIVGIFQRAGKLPADFVASEPPRQGGLPERGSH
eukprot:TRINITY_DN73133_c0_g1_i1.p1 TRINITY_DN73133_c0_g1~~TRINITY_DN73133_c0_g1_i1.p1  ORF type:complete len:1034 (-),score=206.45 TRINITY_DN73133_c0_g1_i1:85-3186(-)